MPKAISFYGVSLHGQYCVLPVTRRTNTGQGPTTHNNRRRQPISVRAQRKHVTLTDDATAGGGQKITFICSPNLLLYRSAFL